MTCRGDLTRPRLCRDPLGFRDGLAVQSTLPEGTGYTTLEFKISFVRGMSETSGVICTEGRVLNAGRRVATAEARITDAKDRLLAHATTTCLVFEFPKRSEKRLTLNWRVCATRGHGVRVHGAPADDRRGAGATLPVQGYESVFLRGAELSQHAACIDVLRHHFHVHGCAGLDFADRVPPSPSQEGHRQRGQICGSRLTASGRRCRCLADRPTKSPHIPAVPTANQIRAY